MDKISLMYLEIEDYSQTIEQLKNFNGENSMPGAPKQVQINSIMTIMIMIFLKFKLSCFLDYSKTGCLWNI